MLQISNLNRPITPSEIEAAIKSLPNTKSLGLDSFSTEFYQIFKELMSIWWFLRKQEVDIPQDPAIPLLGIYPNDTPSYHRTLVQHCVHCGFLHIVQRLETT